MQFAVMMWSSRNTQPRSIFGVFDPANAQAVLPRVSSHGFWEDFRIIEESRFPRAAEMKATLGKDGYFLIGAGATIDEVFGP